MPRPITECKPWTGDHRPRKILFMRFQATGDVVITLPWIQDLKDQFPDMQIDFLTRVETAGIPEALSMFSKVIKIPGGRSTGVQMICCMAMLPYLWLQRYDVVIDLQNHWISRLVRKLISAKAWSQFDRITPALAGERTADTINSAGIGVVKIAGKIAMVGSLRPAEILKKGGWRGNNPFIILNPGGAFQTRNWPLENYISFAQQWLQADPSMQFVIGGYATLHNKANQLKHALGDAVVDITGMTTPVEIFAVVGMAKLVLSEDSGLLHMAWVQRIPTVAIFGSTRSDWSAPMGAWTYCFHSSDLPCGNCMLARCLYHDNHCLTRWSASQVFDKSRSLV